MKKNFGKGLIGIILMLVIFVGAFALLTKDTPASNAAEIVNSNPPTAMPVVMRQPTNLEVDLLVKQILQENKITRQGARKLHVGKVVRLPKEYGGTEYRLAKLAGKADCIWFLAEKTLRNQTPSPTWVPTSVVAPAPTATPETKIAPTPVKSEPGFFAKLWAWLTSMILWLIKTIILIALIIFGIWLLVRLTRLIQKKIRESDQRRKLNPDSYPPVVNGGLSSNPAEAGPQIEQIVRQAYPTGPAVVRSERGRLHSRNGSQELSVMMQFGDGQDRRVNLNTSDVAWRITLANGTVLYARASCGNLISGRFELPRGWEFRPEPEMVYVAPEPARTEPVNPNPPTPPITPVVMPTTARIGTVKVTVEENDKKTVVEIDGDNPTGVEVGDINVYFSRKERKAS